MISDFYVSFKYCLENIATRNRMWIFYTDKELQKAFQASRKTGSEAGWHSVITRQQRTHRQEWDEQKNRGRKNRGVKALQKD